MSLERGQAGIAFNSSTAWDYFHINSITKGEDGHYLVSARHASTLYKINGTSGDILWRLGGNDTDFELGDGVEFGFQHHARYLTNPNDGTGYDVISLFDNSVYGAESAGGGEKEVKIFDYSRGKYIRLDHGKRTAELVQAFRPPGDLLVKSQGSLQTLPNGNALINWGSEGAVTEYSASGEVVWHSFLDSGPLQDGLQNYRAFKFNWTGWSEETPALVAAYDSAENQTVAYVSWNGDTRTKIWNFCAADGEDNGRVLASVRRQGFETKCCIPGRPVGKVQAYALGEEDVVLSTSEVVQVFSEALGTGPTHGFPHERQIEIAL